MEFQIKENLTFWRDWKVTEMWVVGWYLARICRIHEKVKGSDTNFSVFVSFRRRPLTNGKFKENWLSTIAKEGENSETSL